MAGNVSKYIIQVMTKGAGKSDKQIKGIKNSLASMATKAAVAAAAFYAAKGILNAVSDLARQAGKVESLRRGFDNLGTQFGFTGATLNKLRSAVNGTVDDMNLMQQANNAMMLGVVKSDDEMAQLFDTAQRLGQALGVTTTDAVNSLVTGMGRQSKLMLDNLGIMVSMEDANEKWAEANDRTVASMTDQERKLAFNNAVLEESARLVGSLGVETLGTAEIMAQMDVAVTNAKASMGEALGPVVVKMAKFFGMAAGKVKEFMASFTGTEGEQTVARLQQLNVDTSKLELTMNKLAQNTASKQLVRGHKTQEFAIKRLGIEQNKQLMLGEKEHKLGQEIIAITNDEMSLREHRNNMIAGHILVEGKKATQEQINAVSRIVNRQNDLEKAKEVNEAKLKLAGDQIKLHGEISNLIIQEGVLRENIRKAEEGKPPIDEGKKEELDEYTIAFNTFVAAQELKIAQDAFELGMFDEWIEQQHAKGEMLDVLTTKQKEQNKAKADAVALDKAEAAAKAQFSKGMKGMVSDLQVVGSEFKKFEKIAKAAAIAQTIFDTYESAQAAFLNFNKSPQAWTNPPLYFALGVAAASTATLAGLARVKSIKEAQYGADFVTSGPQMMMVGEAGAEQVSVTPLEGPNLEGPQGQGITLNISGNVLHESFIEDNVIPQIREGLRLGENMGI